VEEYVLEGSLYDRLIYCFLKVLHGGVILSLTDTMGSLAISTKGQWMTGVSTDINATFVKPAGALDDSVFMETKVVGFGK
jgi:acyl-coenzyme A thioesterase 13